MVKNEKVNWTEMHRKALNQGGWHSQEKGNILCLPAKNSSDSLSQPVKFTQLLLIFPPTAAYDSNRKPNELVSDLMRTNILVRMNKFS